jgi:ABC-type multidrug transport system ATPase subunit
MRAIHVERLEIAAGDVINFTGANGSGKSTLLRLLAGVASPSYGTVRWAGKPPRVALVPQSGGLYPSLTLLETLDALARLYGAPMFEDERAIPGLFELGLHDLADKRVGELSGGYRRLAAIAAAFAVAPDVILLDEPFAALDSDKTAALRDFLLRAQPRLKLLAISGHRSDGVSEGFGYGLACVDGVLQEART